MANYQKGDRVVCIDAKPIHGGGLGTHLECGKVYVVHEMVTGHCGQQLTNVGVGPTCDSYQCGICGISINGFRPGHNAWRFVKLDGLTAHDSDSATNATDREVTA